MDYTIELSGGIGKHIMATSFIKWLSEKFPDSKINVISGFPELFEYNPHIHRNLRFGCPYLFEDYINGTDFRRGEPYSLVEYYRDTDKMHCMKLFPKSYLFNEYNENPETEVYLTKGEEMDGQMFNQSNPNLITLQAFGGVPPGMPYNKEKIDASQRDMNFEFACRVVSLLSQKGFNILQIRGETERPLPNTLQLNLPFRNILPIVKYARGHVGIDSSMMHGAAVFKKPMMIFWGNTHQDNLGYKYDGVFNVTNEHSQHCRPRLQVHDQAGVFPFKSENEGKEFIYSDEDLTKAVEIFVDYIIIKNPKCDCPQTI